VAVWEPPLAYTPAATGYLVEQALYCEYRPLHIARSQRKPRPGPARRMTTTFLTAIGAGWARILLQGEVLGVPVAVSPDAVLVEEGRITAIAKARIRRGLRLYPPDWAPLYLAGLIAEQQGAQNPTLIQIVAEDKARLHHALTTLYRAGPKPAMGEGWKITTRVYDPQTALETVARPLQVLAGHTTPRPPNPATCQKCPYSRDCPWRR